MLTLFCCGIKPGLPIAIRVVSVVVVDVVATATAAVAAYTRAIDHFKGDKSAHANRAAAHLKLRNFLSALDDCSRVVDIAKFLDDDHERRPPPAPLLKAYVRRAAANTELGRFDDAASDLAAAPLLPPLRPPPLLLVVAFDQTSR